MIPLERNLGVRERETLASWSLGLSVIWALLPWLGPEGIHHSECPRSVENRRKTWHEKWSAIWYDRAPYITMYFRKISDLQ